MSFIQALLTDPSLPQSTKQSALDRIHAPPGLPPSNSTTPFWLKHPHPTLSTTQSPSLPPEAEIVIIGTGISAASTARTLLGFPHVREKARESARPALVMLDARDVCSGATGRNGGHILESGEEFGELETRYGTEAAVRVMRMRLGHLEAVLGVAGEYGLIQEAEVRRVEFLSVYFDEEVWREAVKGVERLKECLGKDVEGWRVLGKGEIPEEFCLPAVCGIIAGPAGALWPYKFVTGVLGALKKEYGDDLAIESHTPVTEIHMVEEEERKEGLRYVLSTPRGTIRARHIIHCTNAHVGHLVPGLRGRIYPVRGQMSAQQPGSRFRWQGSEHSWIFNYDRGFDYLTQLPEGSAGKMMFGGGFAQGKDHGLADLGVSSDSELSLYADIHLSGALSAVFGRENWGVGNGVEMMWTGNMGFSADGLPWVGRLTDSLTGRSSSRSKGEKETDEEGEWISCAFSGEGMVHAWLCGSALGTMVLRDGYGKQEGDLSWFPEEMLVTEQRVERTMMPHAVV